VPENDLKQLVGGMTVDELIEARERTPLVHFKGDLVEFTVAPPDEYKRVWVNLQFTNVDVIKSSQPYHFPVAEIPIKYSQRARSGFGFFRRSFGEVTEEDIKKDEGIGIAPHPAFAGNLNQLVGTRLEMLKRIHGYGENPDTGDKMVGEVWMVVGVEGELAEKVDPYTRALELLSGKTDSEFNQAALGDPAIRGDASLATQIVQGTLIPALLKQGKVTKDADGIYHVVVG